MSIAGMHLPKTALFIAFAVVTTTGKAVSHKPSCPHIELPKGNTWMLTVFGEEYCGRNHGHNTYHGNQKNPIWGTVCFDIKPLNDKVKSFVFNSSTLHAIDFFSNAGCHGDHLGHSTGSMVKDVVSQKGQTMSSFHITPDFSL
ncbi:hypothetical protein BV22DRAFT_1046556 [Leucogyrophana mollusca]|uniref:Uncharacterized protein n=1 Tax=Leucogyrophana mollusca TaxID=85980 RepID=A0ACB8BJJ7_9AGAM|nr:hypothetical protein BV22DRAFT_1046556 [Leucogyrophana mollusca]